jgi:hypothetical protein
MISDLRTVTSRRADHCSGVLRARMHARPSSRGRADGSHLGARYPGRIRSRAIAHEHLRGASYFNKEDESILEETIQKLVEMKMPAMAATLREMNTTPRTEPLSTEETITRSPPQPETCRRTSKDRYQCAGNDT